MLAASLSLWTDAPCSIYHKGSHCLCRRLARKAHDMDLRIPVFQICIAAAGLAFPASSQVPGNQTANVQMDKSSQNARLPYTAEYKETSVLTQPNGSTVTQEWTEVDALDSRGRHMIAKTYIPMSSDQKLHTEYSVSDPVAQITTEWSSENLSATVRTWYSQPAAGSRNATSNPCSASTPASTSSPVAGQPASPTIEDPNAKIHEAIEEWRARRRADLEEKQRAAAPKPEPPINEDLGTATIQGIVVHGYRTTTKIPAGSIFGNSTELLETNERWLAVGPGKTGLMVRWIRNGPPLGKKTQDLVKFAQGEPDPTIFRPPADYKILTQTLDSGGLPCPLPSTPAPVAAPAK